MGARIKKFVFNPFQENTLVVDDGFIGVIVDPGCYESHEENLLFDYIENQNITIKAILLTHAHIDHILGVVAVQKKYNVPILLHEIETQTLEAVKNYAHVYGFPRYSEPSGPFEFLKGGEQISFGDLYFEVRFTPGHCVGHVVYYMKKEAIVLNGDVLFAGSFGRVDLPGGNIHTLKESIFNQLFTLPDDTVVYCGHGPETTIGEEKRSNYIYQF